MLTVATAAIMSAAIVLYLRTKPPYLRWRKYAITTGQVLVIAILNHFSSELGEQGFSVALAIGALSAAIMFAGLRYDTGVVIFAGAFALLSYGWIVFTAPPSPLRLPSIVLGVILLGTTTAGIAILVSSLLKLHAESVTSDRLGRFFAPEIVQQIKASPVIALGAVEREVTVLFSDISGFTEKSSAMRPQEVVELLNDYFPRMVDIVFRHHGTLEKYIGDALLAMWGAPFEDDHAAQRALSAAIDMRKSVAELNAKRTGMGQVPVEVHIGVHSGRVAAGHIGADAYMQYAVIGDTTNIASRICSAASPGEILISESTKLQIGNGAVNLTPLQPVRVKGKEEPLVLYRVNSG
jgi:class 3 adenylate cyclase